MFEDEFLTMMPHEIEVNHHLGQDFEGNDVYADAPVLYQCRIVGKGIALRRRFGDDMTVIYDIYVHAGNNVFTTEDQVILPEDEAWVDRTPIIFAVGRYTDEDGHHHVKLQCGWMYHRQGQ